MIALKNLLVELDDSGILTVTINRVEKHNALDIETLNNLRKAIDYALTNDTVRAVIITGAGKKAFVAGGDISEIALLNNSTSRNFAENGQDVFALIEQSVKPIVAAINGFALGGGCELAMSCHLRVASDNAKLGLPEATLGIIPGYGGTQRLCHLVGRGRALKLMLTGEYIGGDESYRIGLVDSVVAQEHLLSTCKELLSRILNKSSLSISMIIGCVNECCYNPANGYAKEVDSFVACCKSSDFVEGTSAFMEKRQPKFSRTRHSN